jgi:hypothetical protein
MRIKTAVLLITLTAITGCGSTDSTQASSTATTTAVATSATASKMETGIATTASKPTSKYPTYSEVVATYPQDAMTCNTEIDLTREGFVVVKGDLPISDSKVTFDCYGVKVTVKKSTTINGITYETGTKLTVDEKRRLTKVSSWD